MAAAPAAAAAGCWFSDLRGNEEDDEEEEDRFDSRMAAFKSAASCSFKASVFVVMLVPPYGSVVVTFVVFP